MTQRSVCNNACGVVADGRRFFESNPLILELQVLVITWGQCSVDEANKRQGFEANPLILKGPLDDTGACCAVADPGGV